MLELAHRPRDWRYCKCGHQPDDHNPVHLGCFKCDCARWTPDYDKSGLQSHEQEVQPVGTDDELALNRNSPCPKGGNHAWIGDDAGDSWCEKCHEVLID